MSRDQLAAPPPLDPCVEDRIIVLDDFLGVTNGGREPVKTWGCPIVRATMVQDPGLGEPYLKKTHPADRRRATETTEQFFYTITPIRRLGHCGCRKHNFLQKHAVWDGVCHGLSCQIEKFLNLVPM
jgi:hypothetical protein